MRLRALVSPALGGLSVFCLLTACRDGEEPENAPPTLPEPAAAALASSTGPTLEVVAQVVARSALIDPASADYKDCLFSTDLAVLSPLSGDKPPRHLLVFFPGFLDRQLQPEAAFKLGDVLRVKLTPFEHMPEAVRAMARCDDVDDFELSSWFAVASVRLSQPRSDFQATPGSFADETAAAAAPPVPWPRSEEAAQARRRQIEADKRRILEARARHGGTWESWEAVLAPFHDALRVKVAEHPDPGALQGRYHFDELEERDYAALCERGEKGLPGPLAMLRSLNIQLRARGIDLIVAPIPKKELVHAEVFSRLAPTDGIYCAHRQRFLLQLLESDIEVIDLVPAFQEAHRRGEWVFFDAEDFHPADGGIQAAARAIAGRLERYGFQQMPGYVPLESRARPAEFVVSFDGGGMKAGTRYPATAVDILAGGHVRGPDGPLPSPLVLMGDSVTVFPTSREHPQNLVVHLARASGLKPDHLTSMGSSAQAARLLAREGGDFLADRWVVVFAFAPTRLFGSLSRVSGGKEGWDLVDLPPLKLQ